MLLSVISVLAAAAAAWTGMISIGLNTILTGFLVCLGAASFSVCLFQTAGSRIGGIFLQFFLVTAFHFLSGGFLPEVFLPESIQRAAPFLPTHILMEGVKMAVTGNESLGGTFCMSGCIWQSSSKRIHSIPKGLVGNPDT